MTVMDGIELMATAMHAAQTKLDVAAANLANVSSTNFHKSLVRATLGPAGLVAKRSFDASPGPLRRTGRAFDLAVAGTGAMRVRDGFGRIWPERSASFERNAAGNLIDANGRVLLGERGPLVAGLEATIDARGVVRDAERYAGRVSLTPGASLESGFLEAPNVDAVREMVGILVAERSFETAQKTLVALDETRQKDADDVARVKA